MKISWSNIILCRHITNQILILLVTKEYGLHNMRNRQRRQENIQLKYQKYDIAYWIIWYLCIFSLFAIEHSPAHKQVQVQYNIMEYSSVCCLSVCLSVCLSLSLPIYLLKHGRQNTYFWLHTFKHSKGGEDVIMSTFNTPKNKMNYCQMCIKNRGTSSICEQSLCKFWT